MKYKALTLVPALVLLALAAPARAGDILDRIVATVNGHIILQSDWNDALRYEAFIGGHVLAPLPLADSKAALDRLIDQELLREQMNASDFQHAGSAEVEKRVDEIRRQYPGAATSEGWQDVLARYRLSESDLKKRVATQLDLLRLVDARLRPGVSIDAHSIESYYNQELLPQLRQSGKDIASLADVTPRIKELLTEQKMNQLLTAWLQNLRSGSQIRTQPPVPDSAGEAR